LIDRIENNEITPFTCFSFIPKTGMGLHKTGIIFYNAKPKNDNSDKKK